ncbi:MAG: potassium efflux system protein [Francisellaceae bacterium]|nr:potassium efflux system protein [Francisellaceae bacterium]
MGSFHNILILLAFAIFIVVIFRRINLPPILGYLFVGMLVGPGGFNWIPITEKMHFLAEFGVVFLMFTIGLEFSVPRLRAMKRTLLGLGGVQVFLCTVVACITGMFCGLPLKTAFIAAGVLALSSTAVVIKQLAEQREVHTLHGSASISILLFQDLAAVLFLILIPAIAGTENTSPIISILWAIFKGTGVFIVIGYIGLWLLRPLFHEVAKSHSTELFMLAALFVSLGAAWVTSYLELSMALGAFLAGLMLGETEFRHQIEIDIRPFRDVLLGFFFITVGALFRISDLPHHWHYVLLILFALITVKTLIIMGLTRFIGGINKIKAFRTGLILAQGGEFGFVILTEAINRKLIDPAQSQVVVATVVLSIVVAPLLIRNNKLISEKIFGTNIIPTPESHEHSAEPLAVHTAELKDHVIICGFGRVGQILARFLEQEKIPSIALDLDPMRISKSTLAGEHSFYGDARNPQVLAAAGLARARMLVISFADEEAAMATLKHVRALRLDLPVFVRTRDDANLAAFQEAGATEVVPESLEASLMLASHLLLTLGVPTSRILYKIRTIHADRYSILRGFFKGTEDSTALEDEEVDRMDLHTITIPEKAYAVGKTIADLITENQEVIIKSITRDNARVLEPEDDTLIQAEDIIVVYATPENFYFIEKIMLQGD